MNTNQQKEKKALPSSSSSSSASASSSVGGGPVSKAEQPNTTENATATSSQTPSTLERGAQREDAGLDIGAILKANREGLEKAIRLLNRSEGTDADEPTLERDYNLCLVFGMLEACGKILPLESQILEIDNEDEILIPIGGRSTPLYGGGYPRKDKKD